MEITKEIIEAQNFTEDQVKAISEFGTSYTDNLIAETKKDYDGKANTDAQAILDDVANGITKETNIERKQGEKLKDFYVRTWAEKNTELESAKNDYLEKSKNVQGSEGLTAELGETKTRLDDALKQLVDFDSVKEKAEKYDPLQGDFEAMKKRVAYAGVKPSFPDNVNSFEADAKWKEFISGLEKDYNIEFDGDKAIAVSKDNKHVIKNLKELVSSNEILTELTKGRQQNGTGAKPLEKITVEGVPFDVPSGTDNVGIQTAIREYLATKGIMTKDTSYAAEFGKYFSLIKKQQTAV